jgi:hypothetical protein
VNTRVVRPEVIWAVLFMEAGLALPIMSVTAQGEPNTRLVPTLLVLLLLPAGYLALRYVEVMRDPAWRVLVGFVLVAAWRLQVTPPTGEGPAVALARFLQIVVPAALAFALWWRGGALADAELTSEEVRTEFLIAGSVLLMVLVVFHGMVSGDSLLLGSSVGLFAVSGLLAIALARQDAADIATPGSGRILAVAAGLIPAGVALLLLGVLRPSVLVAFWFGLGRLIELALTPIGLLLAWLFSLLPQRSLGDQPLPPPPLPPALSGDFRALIEQQRLPDWVAWASLTLVFLLVLFVVAGVLRILLDSAVLDRSKRNVDPRVSAVAVDRIGNAQDDMRELVGWMLRWLRSRLGLRSSGAVDPGGTTAREAWLAYRALLEWADHQGLRRRPSETTGQLESRLIQHAPEASHIVSLVTDAFESERYGDVPLDERALRRIRSAVDTLAEARRPSDA